MWILNDEKHKLFYQDDEFYSCIRHQLRRPSMEAISPARKQSSDKSNRTRTLSGQSALSTSPPFPMSPRLKQKIMSHKTPDFATIPFSKMVADDKCETRAKSARGSAALEKRDGFRDSKNNFTWNRPGRSSSFSSDSDEALFDDISVNDYELQRGNVVQFDEKVLDKSMKDLHIDSEKVKVPRLANGRWSPGPRVNFVKSASEGAQSAPNSPQLKLRRQISAQITRSGSQNDVSQRKVSLPNKPSVTFCTQIKVYNVLQ